MMLLKLILPLVKALIHPAHGSVNVCKHETNSLLITHVNYVSALLGLLTYLLPACFFSLSAYALIL